METIPYDLTAAKQEIQIWHKRLVGSLKDYALHERDSEERRWYSKINEDPDYLIPVLYKYAKENGCEIFTSTVSLLRSLQRYAALLEDMAQISPSGGVEKYEKVH